MPEPFIERLIRFTPDAGTFDRDALLFEAGRASVRPNRGWMGLSAVLAGTQVLALAFVWPQTDMTPNAACQTIDQVAATPARAQASEHVVETPAAESHIWSVRHQADDAQLDSQAAGFVVVSADSEPILRAFGPWRSSPLPSSIVY
jgi:hypothetical protein